MQEHSFGKSLGCPRLEEVAEIKRSAKRAKIATLLSPIFCEVAEHSRKQLWLVQHTISFMQ